jgi:hypothetical protein
MSIGVRKAIHLTSPEYFNEQRRAEHTYARASTCVDPAANVTSSLDYPLDYHKALEQMYMKTAINFFVLEPNCWETLTEFLRYNNRTRR